MKQSHAEGLPGAAHLPTISHADTGRFQQVALNNLQYYRQHPYNPPCPAGMMMLSQCCMPLITMKTPTRPCHQERLGLPGFPGRSCKVSIIHISNPGTPTLTHMLEQVSSNGQAVQTGNMSSRHRWSSMNTKGRCLWAKGSLAGIKEAAAAIGDHILGRALSPELLLQRTVPGCQGCRSMCCTFTS